jgi:aromatic ring-cleaving dioxygenase
MEGCYMQAIEFDSVITDGAIPIPEEYKNMLPASVKVIVFPAVDEPTKDHDDSMNWLGKIYKVEAFNPGKREDLYEQNFLTAK